MHAIILAAGMGKRLKELTKDSTKCMVEVNGVTLIERMLSQLDRLNLSKIVIVVGFKAEKLMNYILTLNIKTEITYVNNDKYYQTNNIYSLYLARDYLLQEDTLLLESDLIFEDSVLKKLVDDQYPSLALVAKYESWMDGTVVTLDENSNIKSFLSKKDFKFSEIPGYYKTVNIYKFSKNFSTTHYVPFLEAYSKALGNNEYYEQVLKVITLLDKPEIKALTLGNEAWYEIDDVQDLDIAESIFAPSPEDRLQRIQKRYGGYWRYPHLLDFCYLVNPFFPTIKLMDEIKANFERLIISYPSGVEVNNLLVAKYFGLDKDQVVIGNGAAELINALMNGIPGKIGITFPTFEEYSNRKSISDIIAYYPDNADYSYSADELIEYFNDKDIESLIVINPDNPSGNYIEKKDIMHLIQWAEIKNVFLILDESFLDFAKTGVNDTFLDRFVLDEYPRLVIVKSISKSFGVPGLRLGVLASGNRDLLRSIKQELSIWNINSFAEFYLQIFEKYQNDYSDALVQFRKTRKDFTDELRLINNLRILPTQANFVMCEVLGKYTAKKLGEILLGQYNILIKVLEGKKGINGQYIRVAIKNQDQNNLLINALKEIYGDNS